MVCTVQKLFQLIALLLCSITVSGQEKWPSPDLKQMYSNARAYIAAGNYSDAVITCKQAVLLAPDMLIFYQALGNAYFLSGNYPMAEQTLAPLTSKHDADTQCYRLLAASQAAQKEIKKALSTLQMGLNRFPESGLLYHEMGIICKEDNKTGDALNAWLDGIRQDPAYPDNYYEAAHIYLATDKVTWGLLYGETYLNMQHDTTGDAALKNKLFTSWKTMFDNLVSDKDIKQGISKNRELAGTFETAVQKTFTLLTPVVSDGITTENLVMVRTRFLMDWFATYSAKYPYPLFSYLRDMVSNGRFDIYNEWLFGNAENKEQYIAWNKFHDGDIARFEDWHATHPFHPEADAYNSRNIKELIRRSKRKQ